MWPIATHSVENAPAYVTAARENSRAVAAGGPCRVGLPEMLPSRLAAIT